MPAHIRKGDIVFVRSGDDRGKTGEVVSVNPTDKTCLVKGVNLHTKHVRPSQQRPKGALVKMELPIQWSKVSPVADGKPTRVRFASKPDGSKVRIAVKGGKELSVVSPAKKTAAAAKTSKAKK